MTTRKRGYSPVEGDRKKKKRDELEPSYDDSNDCIIVGEIPREKTPVIDLDTVGEVEINSEEAAGDDEDIYELPVSTVTLSNFGARPDFDRKTLAHKIQKFKKEFKEEYEEMKLDIMHHYEVNIQKENTISWKREAKEMIQLAIRNSYPKAQLYIVGSTFNGCGSYNSDMDVCAIIPEINWNDKYQPDNRIILKALYKIRNELNRHVRTVKKCIVIRAVVPILQIEFDGSHYGLDVDLNINNYAGIRNTHLIQQYSKIDERFPILCLLIKHWAIVQDINSAQSGSFNSYSLILLVLHYMQCVCQPPILPNLLEMYPDKFNNYIRVEELEWNKPLTIPKQENCEELTAILLGFFDYYATFDFEKYAISIRHSRVIPKSMLPEKSQHYGIFIEEPYDHRNTARCVHGQGYDKIISAFSDAVARLYNSRSPNLKSLGIEVRRNPV